MPSPAVALDNVLIKLHVEKAVDLSVTVLTWTCQNKQHSSSTASQAVCGLQSVFLFTLLCFNGQLLFCV